jgi:hypothetical protein
MLGGLVECVVFKNRVACVGIMFVGCTKISVPQDAPMQVVWPSTTRPQLQFS